MNGYDIKASLTEAAEVLNRFLSDDNNIKSIEDAAVIMAESLKNDGKILSAGNGGSHCDAMHFAEELTGRYRENRPSYGAIAISDPSHLSCVSNDFGYEYVFSRYLEGVGRRGDVFLGISTSGNSKNIIRAVETAKANGLDCRKYLTYLFEKLSQLAFRSKPDLFERFLPWQPEIQENCK